MVSPYGTPPPYATMYAQGIPYQQTPMPPVIHTISADTNAAAVSLIACYLLLLRSGNKLPWSRPTRSSCASGRRTRRRGLVEAIGNTPLIRINSLFDATRCQLDSGEGRVPESGWQREGPCGSKDNRGGSRIWRSRLWWYGN